MKYYIAVYQKLKEIFDSQSTGDNDVTLLCPSLRLYEKEDLSLLKPQSLLTESGKIPEAIIKKQQFSYELNSVPISNTYWDLNPNNSLFDIYREILNKVGVKDLIANLNNLDTSDNKTLFVNDKETKEYKAYQKYIALYEEQVNQLTDHFSSYDEDATAQQKENWQDQYLILRDKSELALAELKVKGFKNLIDKAIDKVNEVSKNEAFLNYLQTVKNGFDSLEKTDITTLSAIHDINFIPYDFMDNESGWSSLKMEKADLDLFYNDAKKNAANFPGEIFNIDYDESIITGIELDYSFVHLKRGWFNKEIFNSDYFEWTDDKKISDGETISNEFRLSAYPKIMILIKNLKIKLDTSISESEVNNPNQLIYFGPLLLKQQLFINKRTNEKFLKAVTNNQTIKSNQLNYLKRKADSPTLTIRDFRTETLIKPIVTSEGATIHRITPRIRGGVIAGSQHIVKPTILTPKPHFATINPNIIHAITINPHIFIPLNIPPQPTAAKIFLNVTDSASKTAVYKSAVTVKGTDNNRILELETNEEGAIQFDLGIGTYSIEIRIDDYELFENTFKVANVNPQTLNYSLKREQISYSSFFLLGMVCEKIGKTPK